MADDDIQEFIDEASTQVCSSLNHFVEELRDKVDAAIHAERDACISALETMRALLADPTSVETLAYAIYILRLRDTPENMEEWTAQWSPLETVYPGGSLTMRLHEDGVLEVREIDTDG